MICGGSADDDGSDIVICSQYSSQLSDLNHSMFPFADNIIESTIVDTTDLYSMNMLLSRYHTNYRYLLPLPPLHSWWLPAYKSVFTMMMLMLDINTMRMRIITTMMMKIITTMMMKIITAMMMKIVTTMMMKIITTIILSSWILS